MKKSVIALLGLVFIMFSCKDKEVTKKDSPAVAVKENFSLTIEGSAAKKDDFALYYTEDNSINFNADMTVWCAVIGENKKQMIVFDLSEEKIPTDVRLDFGINKAQDSVEINNIKINFYGNELAFKGSDFFKYFTENKEFTTKIDVLNGSIKIFRNGSEYKTPLYYPTQLLIDEIAKLTK